MAYPMHRGALIGCGFIANQKHLPALAKLENRIQLVAFCDLVEERAQKAAKEYGTPDAAVYTDYREMLRRSDLDVVYILTPNRTHCELTIAALESGKDVLCEKPMALNSVEAERMCEAARASGRQLTIGYQNRYRLDSRYLKKWKMESWAKCTWPRPTPCDAGAFPHGACSSTRPSRAVAR